MHPTTMAPNVFVMDPDWWPSTSGHRTHHQDMCFSHLTFRLRLYTPSADFIFGLRHLSTSSRLTFLLRDLTIWICGLPVWTFRDFNIWQPAIRTLTTLDTACLQARRLSICGVSLVHDKTLCRHFIVILNKPLSASHKDIVCILTVMMH